MLGSKWNAESLAQAKPHVELGAIALLSSGGPAQGREHRGRKTHFMKETPDVLGEVSSVDENQEGREK